MVSVGRIDELGYLPFSVEAIGADMRGQGIFDAAPPLVTAAREIARALES